MVFGGRKGQFLESEEMSSIHGLEGRISYRCMFVPSVGHSEGIHHGYSIKHSESYPLHGDHDGDRGE